MPESWNFLVDILILVLVVFIGLLGLIIIIKMWKNEIDLSGLVSEGDDGKASLSRFQFLLFTFIIGGAYLTLAFKTILTCSSHCTLPGLDDNVIWLLGISGGSYVGSKFVQKQGGESKDEPAQPPEGWKKDS